MKDCIQAGAWLLQLCEQRCVSGLCFLLCYRRAAKPGSRACLPLEVAPLLLHILCLVLPRPLHCRCRRRRLQGDWLSGPTIAGILVSFGFGFGLRVPPPPFAAGSAAAAATAEQGRHLVDMRRL